MSSVIENKWTFGAANLLVIHDTGGGDTEVRGTGSLETKVARASFKDLEIYFGASRSLAALPLRKDLTFGRVRFSSVLLSSLHSTVGGCTLRGLEPDSLGPGPISAVSQPPDLGLVT